MANCGYEGEEAQHLIEFNHTEDCMVTFSYDLGEFNYNDVHRNLLYGLLKQ